MCLQRTKCSTHFKGVPGSKRCIASGPGQWRADAQFCGIGWVRSLACHAREGSWTCPWRAEGSSRRWEMHPSPPQNSHDCDHQAEITAWTLAHWMATDHMMQVRPERDREGILRTTPKSKTYHLKQMKIIIYFKQVQSQNDL